MADNKKSARSPEEIRRDIEATRGRMTGTIGQLETQLNPQRLKAEATDKIRENTVGRVENFTDNARDTVKGAGNDVFESIKENPIPAALTFIGLGWLFMESRNKAQNRMPAQGRYAQSGSYSRYDRYDPYSQRYEPSRANIYAEPGHEPSGRMQQTAGRVQDRAQQMGSQAQYKAQQMTGQVQDTASQVKGQVQDTAQQVKGQVQDKAQQVAGTVQDTASQVAGTVQDTASQVADSAQQFASQAQDQMGQWADAAQEQAYVVRSRFEQLLDEQPLLVGAAAVALGAAIGLSLPSTPKEDELFGPVRDDVMEQAKSKASETMDKVQTVAQKTVESAKETAKDEAQKQNLPTGS